MPRKKTTSLPEKAHHEDDIDIPRSEAVMPPLPTPKNYTPYYVLLLIVFAFLLGALTTKIQYLQNGTTTTTTAAAAPTQAAAPQQPQGPAAHVDVANGHFPVMGQDTAKVTIVEFADPRCPFCKQFHDTVLPQLKTDYIDTGKVKLYFRNFDFLGPASTVAGNALECANEQGHFWDLEDYFYTNQPDESDTSMYTTDKLSSIAGTLGMDSTQFSSCLGSNKDNNAVSQDMTDGQKAGVNATPTFFIDGTSLVGAQPYESFKTIIDQELAKK